MAIGFSSLRYVGVCVTTCKSLAKCNGDCTLLYQAMRHPHDAYYLHPTSIYPLFALPNIKSLSFTLLGDRWPPVVDTKLEPRSSSVEELFFDLLDLTPQSQLTL